MIFKLLVVDDEVTMRKGISNYMNWASIDCQVVGNASDGVEAMEFLDREPVDIVITDIKMPAADGLEVARYVYEHHPHTKVIILTGYADFQYAQTAIKYRVTSFILKPTNKKGIVCRSAGGTKTADHFPKTGKHCQGRGIFPEGSADAGAYRPPLHFGIKRKTPVPWTYHGVLLCCSLQTCVRRS